MKTSKVIVIMIALMIYVSAIAIPAFAKDAAHYQDDIYSTFDAIRGPASPPVPTSTDGGLSQETSTSTITEPPIIESVVPSPNPFTPPGTGTVVDNATDGDGKEFFTIMTEDGSVFYLVIDRHRGTENVYLLSAVTVEDLLPLAQQGGGPGNGNTGTISAIPPIDQPAPEMQDPPPEAPEEVDSEQPASGGSRLLPILVVVAGVGGAAYYFKIVKGKKELPDDDEDDSGEYDDEDEPEDEGTKDYGDDLEDEENSDWT